MMDSPANPSLPLVNIRGKAFTVLFKQPPGKNRRGLCDFGPQILYIDPRDPDTMLIALHEALHAAFPDLNEEAVKEGAHGLEALVQVVVHYLVRKAKTK